MTFERQFDQTNNDRNIQKHAWNGIKLAHQKSDAMLH